MNYRLFTDTSPPKLLANFDKPVSLHPNVGDIILLGDSSIKYVITKQQDNTVQPEFDRITETGVLRITEEGFIRILEQDPIIPSTHSFDFFVSIQNTTPDSVSLRRSNDNVQRKMNMFG